MSISRVPDLYEELTRQSRTGYLILLLLLAGLPFLWTHIAGVVASAWAVVLLTYAMHRANRLEQMFTWFLGTCMVLLFWDLPAPLLDPAQGVYETVYASASSQHPISRDYVDTQVRTAREKALRSPSLTLVRVLAVLAPGVVLGTALMLPPPFKMSSERRCYWQALPSFTAGVHSQAPQAIFFTASRVTSSGLSPPFHLEQHLDAGHSFLS